MSDEMKYKYFRVLHTIRGSVRPLITVGLVAAFIAACLTGKFDAAKEIGVPMGITVAWWFRDRSEMNGG